MQRKLKHALLRATPFASLAFTGQALAHVGQHEHSTLAAGFLHPFMGLDHLLAMALVGIWAAQFGGRALLMLPAAFVLAMLGGCFAAMGHLPLGFVEAGIAASVLALGAVVAAQARFPAWLALVVVAAFGVFHGYAHGSELPDGGNPASYIAGFVAATALLHAIGVAAGVAITKPAILRLSGGFAMLAGAAFLVGS